MQRMRKFCDQNKAKFCGKTCKNCAKKTKKSWKLKKKLKQKPKKLLKSNSLHQKFIKEDKLFIWYNITSNIEPSEQRIHYVFWAINYCSYKTHVFHKFSHFAKFSFFVKFCFFLSSPFKSPNLNSQTISVFG